MQSIYWFRSDLRINDNIALAEAIAKSESLIAVFILTPTTWKKHDAAASKVNFILENLKSLSNSLLEFGIPLLIRVAPTFSDCPDVLDKLCEQYKIDAIYFSHEYPIDERNRDAAVEKKLKNRIKICAYHQQLVLAPGKVLNKQNEPFKVFTPFKKSWLYAASVTRAWQPCKGVKKQFKTQIKADMIPDKMPGFIMPKLSVKIEAGEAAAQKKLKQFCQKNIQDYDKNRDYPNIDGTSGLSVYLAQGVISPRQCIAYALKRHNISDLDCIKNNHGISTWISELVWRDFYYHIIYFHPSICKHKPFKAITDNIPWRYDDKLLEAWKSGMTGFPIVDAAMRQLLQTGWMHNRLRMITAMFLSKILLLDWRLGEKYFMQHLIDGDFAANNGGWQWCASTGTDAVPYFRIFNPTTQSQKFDPNGDFIRKYCPELSHLDKKTIHEPFAFQVKTKDLKYPKPIVDYKLMRQKTLGFFKNL